MTAVVDSYLLRGLAAAGWAAMMDACASCGTTENLRWFSPQLGGAVCPACRASGSVSASPELLALLGALLAGRWEDVQGGVGLCHMASRSFLKVSAFPQDKLR